MTSDTNSQEGETPAAQEDPASVEESWRADESARMKKIRKKRRTGVPDPNIAYRGNLAGETQVTDELRTNNVAALVSVIDAETTAAYGRKTSLETRAASILVAGGAVVTVFLTLRQALGLDLELLETTPACLVLWGLICAGVALVAGIIGAVPLRYVTLDGEFLRVLLRDDVGRADLREQLADLRASALTRITSANAFKGWVVLIGYILIVAAVILLALALIMAGDLV